MFSIAIISVPGTLLLLAVLLFLLPTSLVKRGAGSLAHRMGRAVGDMAGRASRPRPRQERPRELDATAASTEEQARKILGLSGPISPDLLKARWRELSKQYHPDQVHHLGPKLKAVAEREMKDINAAYDCLRRKYGE